MEQLVDSNGHINWERLPITLLGMGGCGALVIISSIAMMVEMKDIWVTVGLSVVTLLGALLVLLATHDIYMLVRQLYQDAVWWLDYNAVTDFASWRLARKETGWAYRAYDGKIPHFSMEKRKKAEAILAKREERLRAYREKKRAK